MSQTPPAKGLRIRIVNILMLCLSIILFILVLYSTFRLSKGFETRVKAIDTYLNWEKSARDLQETSNYLANQARLFAQTGNTAHVNNYFNELLQDRTREKSIEFLEKNNLLPPDDASLQETLRLSNMLAEIEIYSIRMVADALDLDLGAFPKALMEARISDSDLSRTPVERLARAQEILYNANFQDIRKQIQSNLSSFLNRNISLTRAALTEETRHLGEVVNEQRILLIALCVLNILTFVMIIFLIMKPLKVYLRRIQENKMFPPTGGYEFRQLARTYNEIFAIKERHSQMMRHKAEHDPLTGLLNRRAFDSLRELLASATEPVGLLLIDVDKFKGINDTYGHAVGDAALCHVAELLKLSFRSNDLCIRMGGDEFAVLMQDAGREVGEIVKKKVAAINQKLQKPEKDLPPLSISVGGAFSDSGYNRNLYMNADSALYRVKGAGRSGCAFYGEDYAGGKTDKP